MLAQTGEHGLPSSQSKKPLSVYQLYRNILQNEGVLGLWAGNGANLLRVFPAKAVVFSSNDVFRKLLRGKSEEPLSAVGSFVAGGMSGMSATAITYPLDFARGRIAGKLAPSTTGGTTSQKQYAGIVSTVVLTVKDEGILALYKGATPTLLGAMPYEGIKFGTVGVLEVLFPLPDESIPPSPLRKMAFGGMGGIMAGIITYPNDTVRRLLQLQGSRGTTTKFTGYL